MGGALVGVALGSALPAPVKGLEFALCALFTVLTLDAFRSRREIPSALLAGASVAVALVLTWCRHVHGAAAVRRTAPGPARTVHSPTRTGGRRCLAPLTLALRALPFAVLGRLRGSALVRRLSEWMPVGILAILTVTALHGTIAADPRGMWFALLAVAVTAGVHLTFGRRTILSVGIGTAVQVVLLNAV